MTYADCKGKALDVVDNHAKKLFIKCHRAHSTSLYMCSMDEHEGHFILVTDPAPDYCCFSCGKRDNPCQDFCVGSNYKKSACSFIQESKDCGRPRLQKDCWQPKEAEGTGSNSSNDGGYMNPAPEVSTEEQAARCKREQKYNDSLCACGNPAMEGCDCCYSCAPEDIEYWSQRKCSCGQEIHNSAAWCADCGRIHYDFHGYTHLEQLDGNASSLSDEKYSAKPAKNPLTKQNYSAIIPRDYDSFNDPRVGIW